MGATATLNDLGFQPQTAPAQAPAEQHPLADLGFKPAAAPHPLADLGFKPVATAAPAPGVVTPPPGVATPPIDMTRVAGAQGTLPQPAAHPAADLQPSLVGQVLGATKEAATHPIETLTGADLPSQTAEKQAMLEQGAAGGSKIAQSALEVQKTAQAPLLEPSATKGFQKVLDPKSKNVFSRVLTGGTKAVEALSAPDNLMLLGSLPFAPEDATTLISGVFGAQMAEGAGHQGYDALRAAHRGDYGEAAEQGAVAVISAAMAAASAKHATAEHGAAPTSDNVSRGTTEAEKPVLHDSNNVEELRASAERQAPEIGDKVAAATEGVKGAKLEAVRDSKDTDRIDDKAERQGIEPNQIADIAAAKVTVPDQAAADKVLANLHEQMPVESVNGSLDEPGKNGVRQVQAVVNTGKEGEPVQRAEVLIQTPEMHEATDRTHDDYREAQELRADGKDAEAGALEAKITKEHEVAAGKEPVAAKAELAELPERPALGGHDGRATDVLTPTRKMPSTYKLVEAADLVPSHNPQTFDENPTYPKGVQERDYKGSKEAQSRVIQQAQNYDPAYTVNTNPDAVNGPPIITPDGTVLGGNSRAMSTQRLYAEGKADGYRDTLKRDAATYGLTTDQVAGMKEPVLVRQIERPGSVEDARRIGSELNKSMTGALGVSERAVSAGKNLKPETLRTVADMLQQDDSSLRELLAKRGPEILKMMQADGAITERERPQFVDAASGGLSEEGKTFFERALLGSVIDDPRLMDAAPKSILGKLERSLGSIASFGSRPDEWNLLPALRQAVAEHAAIAKNGSSVDLHLNQRDMFGPERNPVVDALVRTLDEKPTAARAKFDQYAKDADQNPHGQTKMFGGGEAYEAFNEAFGSKLTDKEYHDGSIQALRTDPTDPTAAAAEPATQETAKRDAGVPQRASGEQASGRGEGDGQPRAPKPPGEQRGQPGQSAGTASEAGPSPAKVLAPKPTDLKASTVRDAAGKEHAVPDWAAKQLKAPKPPAPAEGFTPGRQSTPVEVRVDGNWQPATLDYYGHGADWQLRRSRATLDSGTKLNNLKDTDIRAAKDKGPVQGITSGVGEQAKPSHGAIAYDLDKTLAHYDGYKGPTEIGKPIESEVASLERDLAAGKDVWIFSARAADAEAVPAIKAWTKEHLGKELPVTNVKYPEFARFVDDRAEKPGYMEGKDGEQGNIGVAAERTQLGKGEVPEPATTDTGGRAPLSEKPVGVLPDANGRTAGTEPTGNSGRPAAGDTARQPGRGEDAESKSNAGRKAEWDKQVAEAKVRVLSQNAAAHKSAVIDVAGRKALALDADGALTWHKLFKNVRKVNDVNPLGAGVDWRGMTLTKQQVQVAMSYLRAMQEDIRVAGVPEESAAAGYERMAQLLKDSRNEQGTAVVLRGDYRNDTAREEATHQWQMEHGLDRSDAMLNVADRSEFQEVSDQLREMGYKDATPSVVASELMAKAMAGDPDFKLTDDQREEMVRSFLTEAVEEKGPEILKNLPETDPRVKAILNEVKRGYDYGSEYDQTAEDNNAGGVRPAARGDRGAAGEEVREADGAGARERSGQRPDNQGGERNVQKERAAEGELKPPRPPEKQASKTAGSDEPVFQRPKAPKPPPSMALPGMENAETERAKVSAEEEGKQLSEQMRTPLKNISKDAGRMERDSPLFRGTGDSPLLFQLDKETNKQNPWYLKSAKILDAKMKGPMPGDALVRMLENNGVKADELKWSGLEDLKGKAKVTPEQVAEHLRENAVKVKEVTKGGYFDDAGKGTSREVEPTKYASYQLPGGKNYRELLMTLPATDRTVQTPAADIRELPGGRFEAIVEGDSVGQFATRAEAEAQAQMFHGADATTKQLTKSADFKSSHWDEPNVLAHVRMNDRTTPEGKKLLHLEEIQSDWHQAGRSKGYATGNPTMDRIMGNTVPDAPFKKDWHEMAFRRAVKYAADNGYDGVSWTPGEKHAERYDLSKKLQTVYYNAHKDGTYTLGAQTLNGSDHDMGSHIPASEVERHVGKELARKIIDGEGDDAGGGSRALRGLDLKVGGEGMKGFYDKIIPDYARKFGKQWGAKVGETDISTAGDKATKYADFNDYVKQKDNGTQTVPHLEITPEMRQDVAEQGVPLFQKAKEGENPVAKSVSELVDDLKALPKADKGTALDRVVQWSKDAAEESVDRSAKSLGAIPSKFEKAFAWAKGITAALVHDYKNPLEPTDWKNVMGQKQLADTETALKLQDMAKELKVQAPNPLDRIAMTHYMEANGSDAKLKEWQAGNKARAMAAMGSDRARYLREAQKHYDKALDLTTEQKTLAKRLRQHFNDTLDIAKENGLLEYGYRNYVMHLYEKDEAADLLHLIDTNDLNPNPSFIKRRFHETLYDAEGAGLTPKSKDIGFLSTAYDKSLNEGIASRTAIKNLLDAKAADGRPIAAIKVQGGWVIEKGDDARQVLNQRPRPQNMNMEGYKGVDRPQLRNFLFKPTTADLQGVDPQFLDEDLAFRGDLMIHPKFVSRVEDMLTPSWFERGETGPQKIGHAALKTSAAAKELMTIVAPFHLATEGRHALSHKINPFKVHTIDLNDPTERLLASHGLTLTNYDAEGLFSARTLSGAFEGVPGINKAMDMVHRFSQWQFQEYIPGLKMAMAKEAFDRNTTRYPKLTKEQVAELSAKESNAAFGNLNSTFDRIPRTKTFKSLARLAMFAPDFLESRARFLGQAFTRYGGEQRAALIRSALITYATMRIGNALLNNGDAKWDLEHAFSLVVHGKNYSVRSVEQDALHAITDPRSFIYNRLNPLTTRPLTEFLSGRDQYGRQKSAASQVKDVAKSTLPFGVQKVIQTPDESLMDSLLTSIGLGTSNYRSPTEEAVHKIYLSHIPDAPDDEEKQAESRKLRGYEDKVRSGHMSPAEVWAKVEKKELTPKEAGRTVQRAQLSRLQLEFKALSLHDAIKVYGNANPLEQAELRPELARKSALIAELPEADREKTAAKMQELLAQNNH